MTKSQKRDQVAYLSTLGINEGFTRIIDRTEEEHCHDCPQRFGCPKKEFKSETVRSELWAWHSLQN
jgi:hypothetical protein